VLYINQTRILLKILKINNSQAIHTDLKTNRRDYPVVIKTVINIQQLNRTQNKMNVLRLTNFKK
jgi:hypothetical protein